MTARRGAVAPRRFAVGALALVVTAALAGGCSVDDRAARSHAAQTPGSTAPTDTAEADFAAVRRLLRQRAKALLAGDRRAFLKTVDPGNRQLLAAEKTLFDNLQALPLGDLYYGVSPIGLEPARVRGNDPLLRPDIYEHVQLSRVTRKPASNEISMTFVRRDGRWLVGAEGNEDFGTPERPWWGHPITAAQDDRVLVMVDRGADVGADELLERTRDALTGVTDVLGRGSDDPLLVDATSNGTPVNVNQSDQEAGAVTTYLVATDLTGREVQGPAGHVIKANPDHVRQLIDGVATLRHELTHFVLDGYGRSIPLWVGEGIAEYVGYYPGLLANGHTDDPAIARAIKRRPVELTAAGDWGADPLMDYLTAEAFAEFLVTRAGVERYISMMDRYRRLATRRDVILGQGIDAPVLRRVYGLSPDEVARGGFAILLALVEPQ